MSPNADENQKKTRTRKRPKRYETTENDDPTLKRKRKKSNLEDMKAFFNEGTEKVVEDKNKDNNGSDDSYESSGSNDSGSEISDKVAIDNSAKNRKHEKSKKDLSKSSTGEKSQNSGKEVDDTYSDNEVTEDTPSRVFHKFNDIICRSLQNIMSNQMTEMKNFVDSKINEMKEFVTTKLQDVKSMLNNVKTVEEYRLTLPDGFPMKTMEDFDAFANDVKKQNDAQQYFKLWGGSDVQKTTNHFLKNSISDDLAMQFCWQKKGNKDTENNRPNERILSTSILTKIIYFATRTTFQDLSIEDFSSAMQSALRAAKQRYRDRKNRNTRRPSDQSGDRLQTLRELEKTYENSVSNET